MKKITNIRPISIEQIKTDNRITKAQIETINENSNPQVVTYENPSENGLSIHTWFELVWDYDGVGYRADYNRKIRLVGYDNKN